MSSDSVVVGRKMAHLQHGWRILAILSCGGVCGGAPPARLAHSLISGPPNPVLLSSELFRHQRVLVVADEGTCKRAGTAKWALESALRTWLRPVTPPNAEQTGDYSWLTLLTMVDAIQTRRRTSTISPVYPARRRTRTCPPEAVRKAYEKKRARVD